MGSTQGKHAEYEYAESSSHRSKSKSTSKSTSRSKNRSRSSSKNKNKHTTRSGENGKYISNNSTMTISTGTIRPSTAGSVVKSRSPSNAASNTAPGRLSPYL